MFKTILFAFWNLIFQFDVSSCFNYRGKIYTLQSHACNSREGKQKKEEQHFAFTLSSGTYMENAICIGNVDIVPHCNMRTKLLQHEKYT